ncbi:hypothetical protein RUM44_001666 [Polyplax serrata]|uniref:Uncharacterized protein n=1 Tax=Polyplax serrata TaxID=468196 RepID=A0ABR1AKY4_POLSC
MIHPRRRPETISPCASKTTHTKYWLNCTDLCKSGKYHRSGLVLRPWPTSPAIKITPEIIDLDKIKAMRAVKVDLQGDLFTYLRSGHNEHVLNDYVRLNVLWEHRTQNDQFPRCRGKRWDGKRQTEASRPLTSPAALCVIGSCVPLPGGRYHPAAEYCGGDTHPSLAPAARLTHSPRDWHFLRNFSYLLVLNEYRECKKLQLSSGSPSHQTPQVNTIDYTDDKRFYGNVSAQKARLEGGTGRATRNEIEVHDDDDDDDLHHQQVMSVLAVA